MKDSSDRKPMSALKKTALIGGGVLAAGAGGAALALRKKPLRIGTPLSKSKVVNYNPMKTKQAKGRVVDMSARLDAVLRNFQAISTAEQPYNYSGCGMTDSGSKPNFPSLYLSRSTDKGLMKLQGQGQAVVQYRIKSRTVDESADDGVPLYGASIEIQSLEPIAGSEEGENDLSETLFLREFGMVRTGSDKLMKSAMAGNRGATKAWQASGKTYGSMKEAAGNARFAAEAVDGRLTPEQKKAMLKRSVSNQVKKNLAPPVPSRKKIMAKDPAAAERKRQAMFEPKTNLSSALYLRSFGEARDRDGEGRYSAGNVPGANDYAIAGAVAPKKKMGLGAKTAIGAGVAGAALGGGAMAMRKNSALQGGLRDAILRGATRAR